MNLKPQIDDQGYLQEEISCPACKGNGEVEGRRCGCCRGQGVIYVNED